MAPKVSVVIPCYNLGRYLDEAVDSVLAQTYEDYEIIVINDGSTDASTNARVEAQRAKPRCTVYVTENQGLPATRNYAIERAAGAYVCCLDADDMLHKDFLKECVAVLDADAEDALGFVTTTAKVFGAQKAYWPCSDYDPTRLMVENPIHVASLFRRRCWEEVGGYAVNLSGFQDWNFWISIVAKGYRWTLVKRPLFLYRVREGSMIETSEQKRAELKRQIVANNLDFFRERAADALDAYERLLSQARRESQARETEVARTALEKLQGLYQAHQQLKRRHEQLAREFAGRRKRS